MKYSVDNAHREFFSLYRWIEFEDLIAEKDLVEINDAIDQVVAARIQMLDGEPSLITYRDLWRDHKRIQQFVAQRRLAEMVADLMDERPLRLAFDQAILTESKFPTVNIENLCAFRGLAGGLVLCLKAPQNLPPTFFPAKAGNGICIAPTVDLNLSWSGMGRYLLIGYGKAVTLFVHQADDAYASTLRGMGYNYGDRLVDRLHPVVIR